MHPVPDRATDLRASAGDTGIRPATVDARMTVKIAPDGTVVVSGEVDSATAPHLCRSLLTALHAHPEGVTLDLAAVTFCDCAGLGALLTARAAWVARTEEGVPGRTPGLPDRAAPAARATVPRRRRDGHRRPRTPLSLGPVSPRMARLFQLTGTGALFPPPTTGRTQ